MNDTLTHLTAAAASTLAGGAPKAPRARSEQPPGEPREGSDPAGRAPNRPGWRILVVEDDILIQMVMGETLVSMGHEVCAVAATEEEAVQAALRSRPYLMIVDWHLGPGSGLAAVRQILRTRAIPHIFVSGDVLGVDQLSPGAVALQKPFQEPELARAIARAMSRSGT